MNDTPEVKDFTPKVEDLIPKVYKMMTGEDIVAYEEANDDKTYRLKKPLAIHIGSSPFLGQAFLHVREWIPPIAVRGDSITIDKALVMSVMDCNDDFVEEYKELSEYFYSVTPTLRKKQIELEDKAEKGQRKILPFRIPGDDSGEVH